MDQVGYTLNCFHFITESESMSRIKKLINMMYVKRRSSSWILSTKIYFDVNKNKDSLLDKIKQIVLP